MNSEQFARIFEKQVEECRQMLLGKAAEYATDDDRLHNFNAGTPLTGQTPQQVLAGYMLKHTISLYDMIHDDHDVLDEDRWNEKITDHINYLILLQALVTEARWDAHPALPIFKIPGTISPETAEQIKERFHSISAAATKPIILTTEKDH